MAKNYTPADPLLTAQDAAVEAGCSLPTFWRGVSDGRFPKPFYPAARAPRWRLSEIHAALEATRMSPQEAMTKRRAQRLTKEPNDIPSKANPAPARVISPDACEVSLIPVLRKAKTINYELNFRLGRNLVQSLLWRNGDRIGIRPQATGWALRHIAEGGWALTNAGAGSSIIKVAASRLPLAVAPLGDFTAAACDFAIDGSDLLITPPDWAKAAP
jgi:predicted DNA-binding transcriptional regulator AlpA